MSYGYNPNYVHPYNTRAAAANIHATKATGAAINSQYDNAVASNPYAPVSTRGMSLAA